MFGFLLAQKGKQSQMFTEKGKRVPTTFLKTTPSYLIDVKWPEVNGYGAVKVGMGQLKNIQKPVMGMLKKAGIEAPLRFIKEKRIRNMGSFTKPEGKNGLVSGEVTIMAGEAINPEMIFKVGDIVDVSGTSKGKGFLGVVGRHNFAGGPKTHGQSDRHRAPGSMGQTTTPGRTYKGKRMAGRTGGERVTVKGLEVMSITPDGIVVAGLVPGNINGLVEIKAHTD